MPRASMLSMPLAFGSSHHDRRAASKPPVGGSQSYRALGAQEKAGAADDARGKYACEALGVVSRPSHRTRRRVAVRLCLALACAATTGCGDDIPTFDPLAVNTDLECGRIGEDMSEVSCGAGEVCVGGRCYDECSSNSACISPETCVDGVCSLGTASRRDAGADGDVVLCDGQPCGPGERCGPDGTCVECLSSDDCVTGVCNTAIGQCATPSGDVCSPCTSDAECGSGTSCVDLGAEMVCLEPCVASVCDQPFACFRFMIDEVTETVQACVLAGAPCALYRKVVEEVSCDGDASCLPMGASEPSMVCGPNGMCRLPCQIAADCFDGQDCINGFCS